MATALSQKYWHLLFFRAAEGLGETFYFPASMSFISDYHPKRTRSRAMGSHQTSVYAGTFAGGYFSALIAETYGWRWSFVVFGALGMILGFILTRLLVEPVRGAAEYEDAGIALEAPKRIPLSQFLPELLKTPTLLILMAAFLFANAGAAVLLTWMPAYLFEKFELSLSMSGLTAVVYVQVASIFGASLSGWLADTLRKRFAGGRMLVQAVGVLGVAPFIYLCGAATDVQTVIFALTGWGFFKGLYDANIFASAYDVIRPELRGTAAGFMNTVGWLGGAGTAPIIIGMIAQRSNLGVAITATSIVYVLAAVLLVTGALFTVQRDSQRMQTSLTQ